MAYSKQNFTDGKVLMASHLNHIEDGIANMWDVIYPVGSIYMSMDSTSPAQLFGGTWERIIDRFLLAGSSVSYPVGSTGGEATHTLTVDEMPSHSHTYTLAQGSTSGGSGHADWSQGAHQEWSTQATGGSAAHNNMPPYLSVYMWKRIA